MGGSAIPMPLVWIEVFSVITTIIIGIILGSTVASGINFITVDSACTFELLIPCFNIIADILVLLGQTVQLLLSTLVTLGNASIIPFPFNIFLIMFITIPTAILIILLATSVIP